MRHARLCEVNVIEQVVNVCQTTVVEDAWARGQNLAVHGWVYSLLDGRITDLSMSIRNKEQLTQEYPKALAKLGEHVGS